MDREAHLKADLILLGFTDWRIHYMMDQFAAAKYELGPGHRSLAHSHNTVEYLADEFGDHARYIALLHILLDNKIVDRDYVEELVSRSEIDVSYEEKDLTRISNAQ